MQHADLFDEQPEEFFRLFGVAVGDDLVELVGEASEGGAVGRGARVCADPPGQVEFLLAERLEAAAVAADALIAEQRRALRAIPVARS